VFSIPKPEFPRPEKERLSWLNLNGSWDFALFPAGSEEKEAAFDRKSYDREIVVPYSWVSPLSGVQENVAGIGWYRRSVNFAPKGRLFLCFGAVDYFADVYVNGQKACCHEGGYGYFEAEVTALWQEGGNTIEVRAEDYRRDTQLYGKQGYGEIQGIWQTVWLEDRPQAYIQDFRIVTKINGQVDITVQADAPDGACVIACFDGQEFCAKVEGGKAALSHCFAEPKLWSPDSPYLYEGALALTCGEEKDEVKTYFGIREISTGLVGERKYQWILLNGEPVYLHGTLDQAFNPKGHFTYPTDDDMYQEAWRLKRLGLNMVRIHIKSEEPRKLYWMDKLGVLVMADIPCFWGAPEEEARTAYEKALPELMARDINHPAIFSWVVFNESWGLLHKDEDGKSVYLPKTQEWVRGIYHTAKSIDPTRLVEDNSVCRYDHVETDLNTWHFYINSYEAVRDHIREVVAKTYPGSEFNYIGGNVQSDAPLMNSECGIVWGVDGSAGDSDLAWSYRYILNEYHLHEKICGFIFTEFHDVVNEFNGYYRIDDTDKDFGYQDFCRGMSLKDLHTADFVAIDCHPVQDVLGGAEVSVPLVLSSFSSAHHGEDCAIRWELWHDSLQGRVTDASGEIALPCYGFGATALDPLTVTMPKEKALAVLSLYMVDSKCEVITRNFTTFNVQAALPAGLIDVPVCQGQASGFAHVWQALQNDKLCLGGEGEVSYDAALPEGLDMLHSLTIHAELSAKRVLSKDTQGRSESSADLDFMHGYLVDRGAFDNSYWMTDESRYPSTVDVLVNGQFIRTLYLENDWADARGVLSWHHQAEQRKLDEAGSYGEAQHIAVPSRLLTAIQREGKVTVTFRVKGSGGLAIYGPQCGRYAWGLTLEAK